VYTKQYIEEKDWDSINHKIKKSHPNSKRLNNFLLKKLSEINDKSFELITDDAKTTLDALKSEVNKGNTTNNFFDFAELHYQNLTDKQRIQQLNNAKGRLAIFRNFLKTNIIEIENINVSLLNKFETHLLTTRNVGKRTVVNYFILIRTIYNIALTKGVVERKHYPFGKGKIQIKFPESQKIGLNETEIRCLENLDLESLSQQHALDVWLVSFYFAGMRIGDTLQLRWSDFIDGRLYYRMNKNQKLVTLKAPEKAILILEKYKNEDTKLQDFIFPEMKKADMKSSEDVLRKTKGATRNINRHLKKIAIIAKIEKNLSCHIARHSFASIAGNSVNIQILQKLYRHSSITTTINYQANFVHKDFDDALDSVVNF
jgi:integrase